MIRHPPLRRRTSVVWWLLGCAMAIASLILVATHARTQESIAQLSSPKVVIQPAPDEPITPEALEPAPAPASMSLAEPVAPAKIAKRKRMPAKARRTPARWNPDALFLPQR